jgi:GNAT superfamily N-acetyltransferase
MSEASARVLAALDAVQLDCAPMTAATQRDAFLLLTQFLRGDDHYLASSAVYGDGGAAALERALGLFLARPEIGFVWLARVPNTDAIAPAGPSDANAPGAVRDAAVPVGACVVCYAISTSRGSLVAKLDDVTIAEGWQGHGVGTAMLGALAAHLRGQGATRIDTACHRDNGGAWRFYERLGFRPLDEERIALLID